MNTSTPRALGRAGFVEQVMTFLNVFGPFVGFVWAVVHFWNAGITTLDMVLFVVFYVLTGLGITIGFHRLFTHESFSTNGFIRAILAILGSMALQGPPLRWVYFHRIHHQHSDTERDLHSPHGHGYGWKGYLKGFWYAHIVWFFTVEGPDYATLRNSHDRVLRVMNNTYCYLSIVALSIFLPGFVAAAIRQSFDGFWVTTLWAGAARIFFIHHATWSINSVCHLWGKRYYKTRDQSRDNFLFGLLGFGEGHHHSHHAFPSSARHGLKWWQFDLSWIVISLMGKVGLAKDIVVPSPAEIKRRSLS